MRKNTDNSADVFFDEIADVSDRGASLFSGRFLAFVGVVDFPVVNGYQDPRIDGGRGRSSPCQVTLKAAREGERALS